MPSKLVNTLIQIVSLVLFALVSAIAPEYTWLFFILYFIIIMAVMTKMSMKGFKRADSVKGSPLFKEDNTTIAMSSDTLVLQEVKEQFKAVMLMMFLPFVIIFLVPPIYWTYINPIVDSATRQVFENEVLVRFIGFLAFYSILVLTIQIPRLLLMRGLKSKKQLYTPRSFALYREGLLMDGRLLAFDKDMCYKVDSKRKFVQIESPQLPYNVRLYTLEVSKLADRIREVGLHECRE